VTYRPLPVRPVPFPDRGLSFVGWEQAPVRTYGDLHRSFWRQFQRSLTPRLARSAPEAQQVMGQLQHLSDSLERAAFRSTTHRRSSSRRSSTTCASTGNELKLAKHNLKRSQHVIAQRLITLLHLRSRHRRSKLYSALVALDDMITRHGQRQRASRRSTHVSLSQVEDVSALR